MQEEVTRKTIALAIKAAKLDGKMLQAALRKLLQLYRKARDTPHHGKQTLKQLMRHGTGVSNIEITDANIKAFESTAKKYGIDFALKRQMTDTLCFQGTGRGRADGGVSGVSKKSWIRSASPPCGATLPRRKPKPRRPLSGTR